MTPAELSVIRERCEAATPGPWVFLQAVSREWETLCAEVEEGGFAPVLTEDAVCQDDGGNTPSIGESERRANWEFAARARTDIPALLAEVERLRLEMAEEAAHWAKESQELHSEINLLKAELAKRDADDEFLGYVGQDENSLGCGHGKFNCKGNCITCLSYCIDEGNKRAAEAAVTISALQMELQRRDHRKAKGPRRVKDGKKTMMQVALGQWRSDPNNPGRREGDK